MCIKAGSAHYNPYEAPKVMELVCDRIPLRDKVMFEMSKVPEITCPFVMGWMYAKPPAISRWDKVKSFKLLATGESLK